MDAVFTCPEEARMLIGAVPREEMSDELRAIFDRSAELVGNTDFIQAAANAPEVLDWYLTSFYGRIFYGGRVEPRIKELVRLRLARTHGCAMCNALDTVDALAAGIDQRAVDAIGAWPEPVDEVHFDEREIAALRFADQMALQNMDGNLDAERYGELRRWFGDAEIFELGVTMAVLTGMAKFLFVAELVPTEASCPVRAGARG
jgi:AhpD family alkylhydroperoxidase